MARKQASGGKVTEIAPKLYRIEASAGNNPVTGERIRARERFRGTKTAANERLAALKAELKLTRELAELGISETDLSECGFTVSYFVQGGNTNAHAIKRMIEEYREEQRRAITFGDWCEQFLSAREALGDKRANTYKADRAYAKHLMKHFGDMNLAEIKPAHIEEAYIAMKSEGIGASTLRQAHKLLKRILRKAIDNDLIVKNPADAVETPKKTKCDRDALTVEEAGRVLRSTSTGTPTAYKTCVHLGLSLGARIGEVLGLEWRHIALDAERPHIVIIQQYLENGELGPLKTDRDDKPLGRTVPIDAATVEVLRAWKVEQRGTLNALGIEQGSSTPVITNEVGGYCDRRNFSKWFREFCVGIGLGEWVDDAGIRIVDLEVGQDPELYDGCIIEWHDSKGWPCDENGKRYSRSYTNPHKGLKRHYSGIVYHQLRHTRFTLGIANGMSIPVAMALGGWSSAAMLHDVYLHATPEGIWDAPTIADSLSMVP